MNLEKAMLQDQLVKIICNCKASKHAELAYILEMPKEPGEAQQELGIEKEAVM